MSAIDDYKMALNILAKEGINSPNFVKEFAKAKATLHMNDSMNAIQAQNLLAQSQNNAVSGTISPQTGQSMPQNQLGQNNAINQPTPMEGQ